MTIFPGGQVRGEIQNMSAAGAKLPARQAVCATQRNTVGGTRPPGRTNDGMPSRKELPCPDSTTPTAIHIAIPTALPPSGHTL